jgi:hypothetical protein
MLRSPWTSGAALLATVVAILAWMSPAPSREAAQLSTTAKPGEWRYLNGDPPIGAGCLRASDGAAVSSRAPMNCGLTGRVM